MTRIPIVALIVLLAASAALASGHQTSSRPVQVINVVAERFQFTPSEYMKLGLVVMLIVAPSAAIAVQLPECSDFQLYLKTSRIPCNEIVSPYDAIINTLHGCRTPPWMPSWSSG